MLSFWSSHPWEFINERRPAATRELNRLLQEQERLLELPMSAADMTLYEIRSDQISDLVAQLTAEAGNAETGELSAPKSVTVSFAKPHDRK